MVIDFDSAVREHRTAIYKYCYLRLRMDEHLTDETVNDIFLILYKKLPTLAEGSNVKAYLYRVADNCIKQSLRHQERYYRNTDSLEETVENGQLDSIRVYDEYFCYDGDTDSQIEKVRSALPEGYRELFTYRYIEKRKLAEISELTALPYSTLRLRLSKLEGLVREEVKKIFS